MGFLDNAKDKLTDAVSGHSEKISEGIDKAKDLIDEKTGGKLGGGLDAGAEKAKDVVDGLDGEN